VRSSGYCGMFRYRHGTVCLVFMVNGRLSHNISMVTYLLGISEIGTFQTCQT